MWMNWSSNSINRNELEVYFSRPSGFTRVQKPETKVIGNDGSHERI